MFLLNTAIKFALCLLLGLTIHSLSFAQSIEDDLDLPPAPVPTDVSISNTERVTNIDMEADTIEGSPAVGIDQFITYSRPKFPCDELRGGSTAKWARCIEKKFGVEYPKPNLNGQSLGVSAAYASGAGAGAMLAYQLKTEFHPPFAAEDGARKNLWGSRKTGLDIILQGGALDGSKVNPQGERTRVATMAARVGISGDLNRDAAFSPVYGNPATFQMNGKTIDVDLVNSGLVMSMIGFVAQVKGFAPSGIAIKDHKGSLIVRAVPLGLLTDRSNDSTNMSESQFYSGIQSELERQIADNLLIALRAKGAVTFVRKNDRADGSQVGKGFYGQGELGATYMVSKNIAMKAGVQADDVFAKRVDAQNGRVVGKHRVEIQGNLGAALKF